MALILPSRATRNAQPQGPVGLNLDLSAAKSLRSLWLPGLGAIGAASDATLRNDEIAPFGLAHRLGNGNSERVTLTSSAGWVPTSGGFSLLLLRRYGSALGTGDSYGVGASGTLSHRAGFTFSVSGQVYFDYGGATNGTTRTFGSVSTASGDVHCFVATTGPAGMRIYSDGRLVASNSANPTRVNGGIFGFMLGAGYGGTSGQWSCGLAGAWTSQLDDDLALSLSDAPWQLFKKQERSIIIDLGAGGGGGTAYSLEVTPASYSLSGNDAALIVNQSLIVTPGSYETTGVSADLTYASAAAGYELSVTPGSYSLTGNDASLTATSVLGITPGAYALTGSAADLSAARNLSVTPGDYSVTGEPVELTFTSSGFYVLDVSPGAYALSGADVALAYSAEVPAASMGFQLGGIREVTHKRLIDRILEARAERIKPVAKRARKRARVIEVQAAEIALTGNEAQFFGLMYDWLEQKPQLPPGIDAEEAFMAQVAMEVQRINERRLFEQDEEEALIALLLA